MNITSEDNDKNLKILIEQVRLLYRPIYVITASNIIVGFALIFGLRNHVEHDLLYTWYLVVIGMQPYRYWIYLRYRKYFDASNVKKYANYFVLTSGVMGIIWGAGGVLLLPPDEPSYQLFLIITLVGWGAGAVTTQHSYLPSFFAYFLPIFVPMTIMLLAGNDLHLSLGFMLIAYILALSYYAFSINRSLLETLKLRYENLELIDQLREQKEEAERANMAKSKFLAAASHDLRQPLHALTLFTSVLNDSEQSQENRKIVRQIDGSVHALEALFNALLDISRLDAGTMKVEKCDFRLAPILDRLRNDFEGEANEKGIRLELPVCNEVVYSDPALLEQILRNFLSNAVRYTFHGSVEIRCDSSNAKLKIRVIDTGVGIPVEEREEIFDEFHQLNNPERDRSKGLGLGLAIVRRTADLLGLIVEVDSEPGKGSTFSIAVDHGRSDHVKDSQEPDFVEAIPPDETILFVVIDDESSVRIGMQELLQSWGYSVITAIDHAEALSELERTGLRPDGIIADYRLRDNRTGIEAIKSIHARYGDKIPALIITGDTAVEQLREVNESGYDVLHKPVAPAKLRAFLRNTQRTSLSVAG